MGSFKEDDEFIDISSDGTEDAGIVCDCGQPIDVNPVVGD